MIVFQSLKSILIFLVCCIILSACASVPSHEQLLTAEFPFPPQKRDGTCTESLFLTEKSSVQTPELSPESISIFDWNIYKGALQGWDNDFLRLSDGKDIIFLQEASLDERMQEVLRQRNLHWNLNNAFLYNRNETGVLLASKIPAIASCGLRIRELVISLPKTILISRYAIKNSEKELLVANIHGINITLGTGAYQKQFDELEDILQNHNGPLIVAGDFNNWSDGRSVIIHDLTDRLSLQMLAFDDDIRTTFFGDPIDQILYRGLRPISYTIYPVKSSDHNPISVNFRLSRMEAE